MTTTTPTPTVSGSEIDSPIQYVLFGDVWLPKAPLASESKSGSYKRVSRQRAMMMPYIEANPTALCSLIITDHDGGMADEIAGLKGMPEPSYIALNPTTRSGHIVYALSTPVCLTEAANRRPINYLARIEAGLTHILEGDVAYAGRITKNPYHQTHLPLFENKDRYSEHLRVYNLNELAEPLRSLGVLPPSGNKHVDLATTAIGRNCALFDMTRKWSYRRRGDYSNPLEWDKIVKNKAWEHNETTIAENFTKGALTLPEVTHLAHSISKWTWRNIHHTFQQTQTQRGQKGGQANRKINYMSIQSWSKNL